MGAAVSLPGSTFQDRYELQGKLGTGTYGQVHAAVSIHRAGGAPRAVKIISLPPSAGCAGDDEEVLKAAKREARLWRKVGRHPHCIELLRTFSQDDRFLMVAEKADASILDRLHQVWGLPEEGLTRVVREMLLGVAHCHKRRLVHRDVKLDNFLICGEQGTVKLCDFGLAARMPRVGGQLYGSHGTAPYMSVEMILNKGHDTSTDIWSLGVTCYVLLCGDFPYRPKVTSTTAMKRAVVAGRPPSFRSRRGAAGCDSQLLVDLTKRMMERDPARRCAAADALGLLPACTGRSLSSSCAALVSTDSAGSSSTPL